MHTEVPLRIGTDYRVHFAVRAVMFCMSRHRRIVYPGQFPVGGVRIITVVDAWRSLFLNPPEWQSVSEAKPYKPEVLRRILELYSAHADKQVLHHLSGSEFTTLLGYFSLSEQDKLINQLELQCKLRYKE